MKMETIDRYKQKQEVMKMETIDRYKQKQDIR